VKPSSEKGFFRLCDQRELLEISAARRRVLYLTTLAWWVAVDVPRGVAARL